MLEFGRDADAFGFESIQQYSRGDNQWPGEFEPRVLPPPSQKEQLATLVEALLLEIAAALASGEVGDDKDHS